MNYIHNCKLTPRIDVPGVGAGKLQLFPPSFSGATDMICVKSNAKLNFIRTFRERETGQKETDGSSRSNREIWLISENSNPFETD